MNDFDETSKSQAGDLCKSCGLCCSGHLFIWVKLRPFELAPLEALGVNVNRPDPNQRGFSQPCQLWDGQCTIYTLPHYPRSCKAYKCKQFKAVIGNNVSLAEAQAIIEQAKRMIGEIELLLPASTNPNFRERMVEQIENPDTSYWQGKPYEAFHQKVDTLVLFYAEKFGVTDLFD